ncbi:MAG: deoxyribose-phosphate aldolase [Clostridiales bacterium]|nr:MAG: deoxyribose-phosphate aldolase [Clostridiales bacterium]
MELNKFIDHTILKPDAGEEDIKRICEEAKKHNFMSVCIHPYYIELAKNLLAGSDVKVCTVVGFPLGADTAVIKAEQAKKAVELGADELDMVINIGALKDRKLDVVKNDIKGVVDAAQGRIVKVIIETFYLTEEDKILATKLVCEAGADFVKTCTGFNAGVATVEDVKLMKQNCTGKTKVKAAGGIRNYDAAMAMIQAGAERIGTSAGIQIMEGSK